MLFFWLQSNVFFKNIISYYSSQTSVLLTQANVCCLTAFRSVVCSDNSQVSFVLKAKVLVWHRPFVLIAAQSPWHAVGPLFIHYCCVFLQHSQIRSHEDLLQTRLSIPPFQQRIDYLNTYSAGLMLKSSLNIDFCFNSGYREPGLMKLFCPGLLSIGSEGVAGRWPRRHRSWQGKNDRGSCQRCQRALAVTFGL